VIEDLLDVHHHGQKRPVALDDHLIEEGRVAYQSGRAVDPECVAAAGHQKNQADVRVVHDVVETVRAAVARAFRDRDRRVVDDQREPGRVAFRRDVAGAVRTGGGDQAER
jgi:hypothetical protein